MSTLFSLKFCILDTYKSYGRRNPGKEAVSFANQIDRCGGATMPTHKMNSIVYDDRETTSSKFNMSLETLINKIRNKIHNSFFSLKNVFLK